MKYILARLALWYHCLAMFFGEKRHTEMELFDDDGIKVLACTCGQVFWRRKSNGV